MPKAGSGLPEPPKKSAQADELPAPPLKKKEQEQENLNSPSNAPSDLEGGTSGLTTMPLAPNVVSGGMTIKPGSNFNPFSEQPKEQKINTALGNKLTSSKEMKSVSTMSEGQGVSPDSKVASNQSLINRDVDTKKLVDVYDTYKKTRSEEQLANGKNPFAADDNKNTIDFFISHIKETDPEEYKYIMQRQGDLSKDKQGHLASGNFEDADEDELMIQKTHAELLNRALALKTKVMSGKYDIANNAIKDNYSGIIKEFNDAGNQTTSIKNKIDEIDKYLQDNYEFQQGQIVTNPLNKKKAEEMLAQREDLITQYQSGAEKMDEIKQNGDFADSMELLDDTQKTYDSLQKTYQAVKNNNPEAFNGLPAYKKQLEAERQAQKKKDLFEPVTGDFGINESIGRGLTSILSAAAFIPKAVGNAAGDVKEALGGKKESDYDWKDKMYDVVKSNVDDFDAEYNPLPTGYDKPVYDSETKDWNLKYLPGKVAGTVTEMAPIIATTLLTEGATAGLLARMGASGEIGTSLGAFTGEYIAVADDYYSEAKKSGMSENEAMAFSQSTASVQALLGALYPDVKLMRAGALRKGMETYAEQVAKGVTKMDAVKEASKTYASLLAKEIPQENLQTLSEIGAKNEMYEKMGLDEKIKNSVKNDVIETTILTSIVTLGLGAKGVKSPSRMQQESLYMAASQPTEIMQAAQKLFDAGQISKEQFDDMSLKVQKATIALSKLDKTLPAEKKIKQLIPLMEKIDLKEELANLDDSQKGLINEKIKEKDNEIQDIIASLTEEEIQDYNDRENFFNDIRNQHEEDKKANSTPVVVDENKQQQEGMIELDDSNKSVPIELPVEQAAKPTKKKKPVKSPKDTKVGDVLSDVDGRTGTVTAVTENKVSMDMDHGGKLNANPKVVELFAEEDVSPEKENTPKLDEEKLESLKKSIKENKTNFFNEKISYDEYKKINDSLEVDLKKAMSNDISQAPSAEKVQEEQDDEIPEPVTERPADPLLEEKETVEYPLGEPIVTEIEDGDLYEFDNKDGKVAGVLISPTEFRIDGISAREVGKGKGGKMFEALVNYLKDRGVTTISTDSAGQGAVAMHERAVDSGLLTEVSRSGRSATFTINQQAEKADVVKKLNDDAEILKSFSKDKYPDKSKEEIHDLIEKKYMGALERAYKAKLDKSITGPTYTEYRNKLNEIMSGKISEYGKKSTGKVSGQEGESLRKGEIKAQISAISEKIKEKLLGQGYKNIALSTGLPVTPKMIGDMVDLAVKGIHLGIDLGYTVREATEKAMIAIKKHPKYQKLLASKDFSEKEFTNELEKSFSQVNVPPVPVEEKKPTTKSKKKETNAEAPEKPADKKEPKEDKETPPSEETAPETPEGTETEKGPSTETEKPGKNKRKGSQRVDDNSQYATISKGIPTDEKYYDAISHKQIGQMVADKISEYEQGGLLDTLADEMLEGNSPFPPVAMAEALTRLGDKLNTLAEAETNAAVQGILYDKASKLFSLYSKTGTELGQALSVFSLTAARMPTSAAGLTSFVTEQMSTIQDQYIPENNKKSISDIAETVNSLVQKELEKIASATQSKEWVANVVSSLDALRIDLSEC